MNLYQIISRSNSFVELLSQREYFTCNNYDLFLTFTQQAAAASMTDVAEYINEMKRLHENALRVQEILGSIEDLEVMSVYFIISQLCQWQSA